MKKAIDTGLSAALSAPVLSSAKYVRLARAAEVLSCATEDLIHLAALGELRLLAPVLIPGAYEWPHGPALIPFPQLDAPDRRHFDSTSRVFLLAQDAARIEAVGWAMPTEFVAPDVARSVAQDALLWLDVEPAPVDEQMQQLAEMSMFSEWRAIERPARDDPRTTAEHLFIALPELVRLSGADVTSQAEPPPAEITVHGNRLANLQKQLQIAEAAIYCKHTSPDACQKVSRWAEMIDDNAAKFWPRGPHGSNEEARPPYGRDWIERYLNRVLKRTSPDA